MPLYRSITIKTVARFVRFVTEEKERAELDRKKEDFLFRGQPVDLPLLPTLGRYRSVKRTKRLEKIMMAEFKRTSLPFLEIEPENDWEWLSVAQHFGLPTRLLDWTYSAMLALWFAVKLKPQKDEDGDSLDGVVWIFHPTLEDYKRIEEIESPFDNEPTHILRPKSISKRISAQSGVFTVHQIRSDATWLPLERNRKVAPKLIKILIPSKCFNDIRYDLDLLGVNHSSAFPDLEGLSNHLRWRYLERTRKP